MQTMRGIINATASGTVILEGRALYEADEHVWIERQIAALREGDITRLDRDSLVEYLTEMTTRDKRELESRFAALLLHLLKVQYQREKLSMSWVRTILEQQRQIASLLRAVPSLAPQAPAFLDAAYPAAIRGAAAETGLPRSTFPASSPWSVEAALEFEPPTPNRPQRGRGG